MKSMLKRFVADERGLETVEWAVVAALIVVGLVGVFSLIGGKAKTKLENLDNALSS